MARRRRYDGRRRHGQPLRAIRRGRPRRRDREVRTTQPAGTAAGKRGKPSGRALLGELRGPRLGRAGASCWPTTCPRRSPSGRERRGPTTVEMPTSRTCEPLAELGVTNMTSDGHCDPRRAPRPQSRIGPSRRRSRPKCSTSSRSTPTSRIVAVVGFDLDDFDAAIAELDARYLAGEAAAHARTWSVIVRAFAALNRREIPPTTPDWVNIDHRRLASIAPGEMPRHTSAPRGTSTPDLEHLHRGSASAEQTRSGHDPRAMGPRKRASTPSGGRSAS